VTIFASPAARITLVMSCLFGSAGVILVFLPRWLEVERGLSGAEIGAVLSLAQVARIFTGTIVAHWADNAADGRTPLRIVTLATVAAYAAFFFLAHDFWSLLALGFVALSLSQTLTPLVEAATLRATAEGKVSYGAARAIGSIAFIIANVAGGLLVARFGVGAVVVWVLTALTATTLSSWLALKREPAAPERAPDSPRVTIRSLLTSRRFIVIIVACGLIQSAHAFYYGFSTIVWRGQGISAEMVGILWAFAVLVEVGLLFNLAPVERRVSPEMLILLGAIGATIRWFCMGFAPTGLLLWPLQALHAFSFATAHVGAMRLLYRAGGGTGAAMAQTLYSALSAGLLMGAATLLSGWLYDVVGARGYWAMSLIAAAGGVLALLLLSRRTETSR